MTEPENRRRLVRVLLIAALLGLLPAAGGAPLAAPIAPMVLGTDTGESTLSGMWARRIYVEAFRRLAIPLEIAQYPLGRLGVLADQGALDGELLRVHGYADTHPDLVRVDEPVYGVRMALYSAHPTLRLNRLEDLPAAGVTGEYRRGVAVCERTLRQWLPEDSISDVTTAEQGLRKLTAGRTGVFCDFDLAVAAALLSAELAGLAPFRKVLDIGAEIPLYPYLHRRHAELAPRLAEVLKKMRAEGLIERYRLDVEREIGQNR